MRGKKTLAPTQTTLGALDHDMSSKGSITPSVVLKCQVPKSADDSFVRGNVMVALNDSVFQQASPFRHAVVLNKILSIHCPPILLKFTDSGTDQRNTLVSVKCAAICLFRERNLDMLILVRCAPGQSYINPAERIMSLLNLGLQNCSLQRSIVPDAEDDIKKCNSMKELRKKEGMKEKWEQSINDVKSVIGGRFKRLSLKHRPVELVDPATAQEVDVLQRHLRSDFPLLNLDKLQKVHTNKCASFNKWMKTHSRECLYTTQIMKCEDPECCLPTKLPREMLKWLPTPECKDSDHYFSYAEIKGRETTEKDVPSLQNKAAKKGKKGTATEGTVYLVLNSNVFKKIPVFTDFHFSFNYSRTRNLQFCLVQS